MNCPSDMKLWIEVTKRMHIMREVRAEENDPVTYNDHPADIMFMKVTHLWTKTRKAKGKKGWSDMPILYLSCFDFEWNYSLPNHLYGAN